MAGASEDDWALEREIAYQTIRRGYEGDALHRLVKQVMRAGPDRTKWDEARAAVTWLAQDVANAIATIQKWLERYPDRVLTAAPDDTGDDPVPSDETPEQAIARLQTELA